VNGFHTENSSGTRPNPRRGINETVYRDTLALLTAIRQWRILKTVELIETPTFTKQIAGLLNDEAYGDFQSRLAANPTLGALI
jgi:hypothetical protein